MNDRDEIFGLACQGNEHARTFLDALFQAADVADDLHDRERNGGVATVLARMAGLNLNPFFRAHCDALTSLILTAVLCWDASNEMAKGHDREHYSRQLEQVLFYVALLCGGYDHGRRVLLEWNT